MRIELSQEAEQDIDGILDYTLTTFGEAQAEEYYLSLRRCFDQLSDNPQIGRSRPELDPALRSYNHRSHVVFYDVHDDYILIVRVLHSRMDPERHID